LDDDYSAKRFRTGLISSIRGAIVILEENGIRSDFINTIKESICSYIDRIDFSEAVKIDGLMMFEV
jgi:hypothetical protein